MVKPEVKLLHSLIKDEETNNIETSTIEIKYNCQINNPGTADIIMTVSPDHCIPFDLHWKKICSNKSKQILF